MKTSNNGDDNFFLFTGRHACNLKKTNGVCNNKHLRFYYDDVHQKCKKFFWSGCGGNGNRFFSYLSCNTTCTGIKGRSKCGTLS